MKYGIKSLIIVFFICACSSIAFCAQKKEILLKDNTVLFGEVISLSNGVYKIKTRDAGLLTISEDNIVNIKNQSSGQNIVNQDVNSLEFAPVNPADPRAVEAGVEALKNKMQADPTTMASIADLQNDPEFMAVITDPEIMSAINSGDIEALSSNPKFIKLMNSGKIRNIGAQVENKK